MAEDGRSAVKTRHRQAILAAAEELVAERGGAGFSADDLAQRANVSRRTIFNHFPSLDDVLLTVCAETLGQAVAHLRATGGAAPAGRTAREAMFNAAAAALRAGGLSDPILRVWRTLGAGAGDDSRNWAFAQEAMALLAGEMAGLLLAADPTADPLDVGLLASSLSHGLAVIAQIWIQTAPPGGDPAQADWDRLLERLIDSVGSGYLPR